MKQKLILFISLMLLVGSAASAEIQVEKKPKDKDKIELKRYCVTRRSDTSVILEAYSDGTTLELFADDYAGPATVEIAGSSIFGTVEIDETGYVAINISQLPEGTYTLRITIGAIVFEGVLEQ